MKGAPDTNRQGTNSPGQIVFSVTTAEASFLVSDPEGRATSEPELEAEMIRRAGTMTQVLARIMERPKTPRHWGLNE